MTEHFAPRSVLDRDENLRLEKYFGELVFTEKTMQNRIPPNTFKKYKECLSKNKRISIELADTIAVAMKDWAMERGATHFSHWFQPLTGNNAEKHDSFVSPSGDMSCLSAFTGRQLAMGEPDGSSFPSGELRNTHEARAYTIWDPLTPAYVAEVGSVSTLIIPAAFFSWKGHALDHKIPLLRSQHALNVAGEKLFEALDEPGHNEWYSSSGVEQEFFLISEKHYNARPDLIVSGRTVQGARAAKDQEMNDHYFGQMPEQVLACIDAVEKSCWRLGIPIATRHQEVSPNQFEMAPVYQKCSVASDQNSMLMEILKRTAPKFGLAVLFHEKPFRSINGSGKHNNWSVGNSKTANLLEPGPDPANNRDFLLAVAGVIRGTDLYQDLIRYSVSGASNDHRLGSQEAPPAIISIYLGDWLAELVDSIIEGRPARPGHDLKIDLGIGYLPLVERDPTDRNRTSPFSWTGNKFEVRCVGSSQRPAVSSIMLNSMLADSFHYFESEVRRQREAGLSVDDAVKKLIKDTLTKHKRIVYNGDNYTNEWVEEAKKRGLMNYRTTPEVLNQVVNERNIKLFERLKVWSSEEFTAIVEVDREKYIKVLNYESTTLVHIADNYVIPAAIKFQAKFLKLGERAPKRRLDILTHLTNAAVDDVEELKDLLKTIHPHHIDGDLKELVFFARDKVFVAAEKLRSDLDALEGLMDKKSWPLPSYQDMLLTRPAHSHLT